MKLFNSTDSKNLMHGDLWVWAVLFILCTISLIEVYSASSRMTFDGSSFYGPIMGHAFYIAGGIFIAWCTHKIPSNHFKLLSLFGWLVSVILLLVVLVRQQAVNGAARWIDLGFMRFQPSELAKLSLVGTVAFILASSRDEKGASMKGLWAALLATVIPLAFIVSENLSTAMIICAVIYGICFFAQVRMKLLVLSFVFALGSIGTVGAVAMSLSDETLTSIARYEGPGDKYLHRVPTWVHRLTDHQERPENPEEYKAYENPQKTYAKVAIANSHIIGRGPGNSKMRDYIPQAFSDFIYAIIIEELGIMGGLLVLGMYLLLMYRSLVIARQCKSRFPAYLVMGLALMLVIQAMMNMAVAVGAFPVTGQPLPLVSRGGTSMFVSCAYIGMILSVSYTAKKKPEFCTPSSQA